MGGPKMPPVTPLGCGRLLTTLAAIYGNRAAVGGN